jgi:hypothetical protein
MSNQVYAKLARLLDQYDERRRLAEEKLRQAKAAEVSFTEGFTQLRRDVIRPVFEQMGNLLRQKGHDFSIEEEDFAIGQDGKGTDARISIYIILSGIKGTPYAKDQLPSLSFIATRYTMTVWLHGSNVLPDAGGSAGPRGDYQITQITRDLVESELVNLIAEIVSK